MYYYFEISNIAVAPLSAICWLGSSSQMYQWFVMVYTMSVHTAVHSPARLYFEVRASCCNTCKVHVELLLLTDAAEHLPQ
jgi:hypothetical protein